MFLFFCFVFVHECICNIALKKIKYVDNHNGPW